MPISAAVYRKRDTTITLYNVVHIYNKSREPAAPERSIYVSQKNASIFR